MRFLRLPVLLAALLIPHGPASAADSLFEDPVVARAKGAEVRRSQLVDAFIAFRANLAARGQNVPEERRTLTEAKLLDRLIITQLLANRATTIDRAKAGEASKTFLARTRQEMGSEDSFNRQLKSLGLSYGQFTNRVYEQALSEEVIKRDVRDKIQVSDAAVEKFYNENTNLFKQPDLARASHILFATREPGTRTELTPQDKLKRRAKADATLARLKKGEDFEKLALELSDDPAVQDNKGQYTFARAKDDPRRAMSPEFENTAFALSTNQVSDVITTDFGYHIIKLHELVPARILPLTEAGPRIREMLTQQEMEKKMGPFFEQVKKEGNVEILEEKWARALKDDNGDLPGTSPGKPEVRP